MSKGTRSYKVMIIILIVIKTKNLLKKKRALHKLFLTHIILMFESNSNSNSNTCAHNKLNQPIILTILGSNTHVL